MDRAIQTNTFDAHRLAHFAAARGKLKEMTERLLKAHFTDSLHLGDSKVLADLAGEVGLDRAEALEALEGGAYAEQVRQDEREAAMLGVRGVPFFVFNRKYAVSGAQPAEVFARVLEQTWSEERPLVVAGEENEAAACGADGCELPGKKE
jgi:predicted DsbA family dithiol-disulfide isomerase